MYLALLTRKLHFPSGYFRQSAEFHLSFRNLSTDVIPPQRQSTLSLGASQSERVAEMGLKKTKRKDWDRERSSQKETIAAFNILLVHLIYTARAFQNHFLFIYFFQLKKAAVEAFLPHIFVCSLRHLNY